VRVCWVAGVAGLVIGEGKGSYARSMCVRLRTAAVRANGSASNMAAAAARAHARANSARPGPGRSTATTTTTTIILIMIYYNIRFGIDFVICRRFHIYLALCFLKVPTSI